MANHSEIIVNELGNLSIEQAPEWEIVGIMNAGNSKVFMFNAA